MSAYLDASVIVPTLVHEAATDDVVAYFHSLREQRLISDFAATEVASTLSRLARMRLLTQVEAVARLIDFDGWRAATSSAVEVHAADVRLAYAYLRRFDLNLRAPDALHLAIAHRVGATLVTLDRRLATAASEFGVAVETPEPAPGGKR